MLTDLGRVDELIGRLDGAASFVETMNEWTGGGLVVQHVRVEVDASARPHIQQRAVTMIGKVGRPVATATAAVGLHLLDQDAREALQARTSVLGAVLRALGHRRRTLQIRRLITGDLVELGSPAVEVHAQMLAPGGHVSARIVETVLGAAFLPPPARRQVEWPIAWWSPPARPA